MLTPDPEPVVLGLPVPKTGMSWGVGWGLLAVFLGVRCPHCLCGASHPAPSSREPSAHGGSGLPSACAFLLSPSAGHQAQHADEALPRATPLQV